MPPPPKKPGPSGKDSGQSAGIKSLPPPQLGGSYLSRRTARPAIAGESPLPHPQKTSQQRAAARQLQLLRQGSLGHDVQKLQRLLNARTAPSPQLALDGDFGPLTFAAVVQYQRGVRITQDGIVGNETWHRLLKGDRATVIKVAAPAIQTPAQADGKPVKVALPPIPKESIWEWPLERKFREVVARIPRRFSGQAKRELEAMIQAENLALALVFIAGFMLLSGGTAAIVGWIIFGVDATTSLILALQATYLAASEAELDEAADEFSHVILSVSIAAFFHGVRAIKQKIKTSASPKTPPKPEPPPKTESAKPKPQAAPRPAPATPQKSPPKINAGKQGKHVPGHNNFQPGKSEFTHSDPQGLVNKYAGTGVKHGPNKEVVQFGDENIGNWVDPSTGQKVPTSRGTIHYDAKGGAHIVPANPNPTIGGGL